MNGSKAILCLVCLLAACAAGCASDDPFREAVNVPEEASMFYAGTEPALPSARVVPAPEIGPLSLVQCIEMALRNSPDARLSWQNARGAAWGVGRARSLYFPQADFSVASQTQKAQNQQLRGGFIRSYQTTANASFGVRKLLLDGGVRGHRLGAAQATLEVLDFRHNNTLLEVALGVEVAYYQLLASKSLQGVAEEALRQRERHVELAEKRLEAGTGRRIDVLQARAEMGDAQLSLVEARSQVQYVAGRLAAAMGLSVAVAPDIQEIPAETFQVEREDAQALLAEAVRNRPVLRAAAAEVRKYEEDLGAERAARWPELDATASYGWRDTHVALSRARVDHAEWSYGTVLKVPLFSGFQQTYAIESAREDHNAALSRYDQALRDVELEVWKAYCTLLQAEEAIKVAETYVESTREGVAVAEREYQEGRATIVELIDAQTEQIRALGRRVTARTDWYVGLAQLESAVGRTWQQSKLRGVQ
jgi:outer membrane protein TolC